MGNLDRRSFLKGGVVAAGAAAFAGALSACAPSAPQETGAADETLATTGEAWYGSPADPATFDVVDTVDCEVLVCGLGAGGITAAAAAAEKGMNVIAIEKGAGHGSIKSDIGVIGTRIDTVEVDPLQMLNEHTRYANGWCDPRVTRVWATESGATFDWISDSIAEFGATPYFEYDVDEGTHGVWPVYPTDHGFHYTYTEEEQAKADAAVAESGDPAAAQGILPQVGDYMLKKAEEWGADLRYETPFVQLAQDENGKVTGAYAKIGDGCVLFNASKGVILATGGYEANPDLLAELNPDAAAIGGVSMTQAGCEGEGIKAGIWAGGMKDEIPTLMTFARAAVAPDAELGYPYQGMTCWIGDQPFLKVNLDGARVCCETAPYDYPLHVAALQPEYKLASIWDSDYQNQIVAFHTIGCSRINMSDTVDAAGVPTGEGLSFPACDMMIGAAMEAGIVQQADTIEELAEKLRVDPAGLTATVERYNELAAKGVDEDFGKPAKDLLPLSKPPYFGAFFGGHVLCTLDGLRIDEHMRVLNTERKPIEGLYAVGNCSGSMYAGSYPELFIGNANGRTITHARHAVMHIAGEVK
ncbi:FAD-binding protein [Adlercreutzia sp.]|uniref:FAD-binding protein n=1 Tax=Adlercreutzia sp. TaxID=1872387 RepID=UPI00266D6045|nr:FAD-binding protein [uncultured Adlercreutzia sp.]MBS5739762.1 FAD-binding protein [Adlercreutzia equolifaciens]